MPNNLDFTTTIMWQITGLMVIIDHIEAFSKANNSSLKKQYTNILFSVYMYIQGCVTAHYTCCNSQYSPMVEGPRTHNTHAMKEMQSLHH